MNRFSIKDIENLSGIKAHTWRIWEQRFNLVIPHRKESNHRFYDSEDLKKVLRISFLNNAGIKISKLAGLDNEGLQTLALELLTAENHQTFQVNQLTEAAIDFDTAAFNLAIENAIQKIGMEQTMLQVVFPFLQKIGLLWLTNHVIPAQEHFVSNLVMFRLLVAIDGIPKMSKGNKCVVLFTPEKEHHEIPLLFIQYLLLKQGIQTTYLGQNIPIETLITYLDNKPCTHLLFHQITNLSGKDPDDYIKKLSEQFANVKIIMAGSETQKITICPSNVKLLESGDSILEYIGSL